MNQDHKHSNTERPKARSRMSPLLGCLVVLLASVAFLFTSYYRARSRAAALMATRHLVPIGWHFSIYSIETGQIAPAWEFQFEPPDVFITAPLIIQIGIGGEVVATRPPKLLQILTTQQTTAATPL